MAITIDRPLISADDHMDFHVLPPTLFEERLPADLRDRAPTVVETDQGLYWQVQGRLIAPSGHKQAGMLRSEDHGFRPGIVEHRLADMDRDGVFTQIIYGPASGVAGGVDLQDPKLADACTRVYNDWAAEFNSAEPNRLVVLALLPGHDPEVATDEMKRVATLGHKGVLIGRHNAKEPIFEDSWHRFWDAASEIGLPVHTHLGGGMSSLHPRMESWRLPASASIVPMQLDEVLVGILFSGILEQRPNITFVLGEAGLGWIPYVLDRMDHEYEKYSDKMRDYRPQMLPSEIFRRQVVVTYEEDDLGLELIDRIGVDNVMWASDYPHGDSTWPRSREALTESRLSTLGAEAYQKITHDNAVRVYGLKTA